MRPIDADALKVHVCNMCDDGQRECKGDESCAILCWIDDMPTIEVEPVRRGRWIWFESEGTYIHLRKCSECGNIKNQEETNFCPNCGAQMDEKEAT